MRFLLKVLIIPLALLSLCHAFPSNLKETQVKLPSGDSLQGSLCPTTEVKMFRGIPYAQPPTGSLRFMPPQKVNSSLHQAGSVFNASRAAAPCPQFSTVFVDDEPKPSENCLTVDVYMPADCASDASLPVKVWAYGGFNEVGGTSYPLYDACNLATDSVVVALNYRVGPLGFLGLESAGVEGNMAIQDYLAALQWVQDNVGSFGGDKSRVLLFGQSAGADDTFTVSTMPESDGLISAAVCESGGGQFMTPYKIAQEVGASFAEALNCSDHDLPCLQSRSVEQLYAAYQNIPAITQSTALGQSISNLYGVTIPHSYSMDEPILDGKIIREEPLKVGPRVPTIAGATQSDGALFTIPVLEAPGQEVSIQNYTDFLAAWGPELGPEIGRMYPLSAFNQSGSTQDAVVAAITYIVTEAGYICPSYYILQAAEKAGTDAFGYRFNHTPSCPWLRLPGVGDFPSANLSSVFGATHTSELPFVFGNLDDMPFNEGHCNSTAEEYDLSGQLRSAWTAMAASGSPSTAGLKWPQFSSRGSTGVFVQDKAYATKLDFEECTFWAKVWSKLAGEDV